MLCGCGVCVTGVGDWEKRGKETKKQNFLERVGAINIFKHGCFLLITVNNRTAIIIRCEDIPKM